MALHWILALALAGGAAVYQKNRNEKQLRERSKTPGDAYHLPKCCIEALRTRSNRGTIVAAIGAFVNTADAVGRVGVTKPSAGSAEKTAKFGHDVAGVVQIDWDSEAERNSDFMRGIVAIQNNTMMDVVTDHYLRHQREGDTHANRFWTQLYERKKARLPKSGFGQSRALRDAAWGEP